MDAADKLFGISKVHPQCYEGFDSQLLFVLLCKMNMYVPIILYIDVISMDILE